MNRAQFNKVKELAAIYPACKYHVKKDGKMCAYGLICEAYRILYQDGEFAKNLFTQELYFRTDKSVLRDFDLTFDQFNEILRLNDITANRDKALDYLETLIKE